MIKVLALDMGFGHTGMVMAAVNTDKASGFDILRVGCVHTDDVKKQIGMVHLANVYKSDVDVARAAYLYDGVKDFLGTDDIAVLVSESPTGGGKSAIAIRSMGIATGVLGVITAKLHDVQFVNVQPFMVKQQIGGGLAAGKEGVARAVKAYFSEYAWPTKKRDAEHVLDAAGALLVSRGTDVYKALAKDTGHGRRKTL